MQTVADAPQQHGLVWDVSVYGVGLLLADRPKPGEVIPIELRTESDDAPLATSIQVVYVRELSTGDYFVGAKFTRFLTPAEIDSLVTPVTEKSPAKRGPPKMKAAESRELRVGC